MSIDTENCKETILRLMHEFQFLPKAEMCRVSGGFHPLFSLSSMRITMRIETNVPRKKKEMITPAILSSSLQKPCEEKKAKIIF